MAPWAEFSEERQAAAAGGARATAHSTPPSRCDGGEVASYSTSIGCAGVRRGSARNFIVATFEVPGAGSVRVVVPVGRVLRVVLRDGRAVRVALVRHRHDPCLEAVDLVGLALGITVNEPATGVSRVRSLPDAWKTGPVSAANVPESTTPPTCVELKSLPSAFVLNRRVDLRYRRDACSMASPAAAACWSISRRASPPRPWRGCEAAPSCPAWTWR